VSAELPSVAWVAALAGLPGMGPARLRALLGHWSPDEAWRRVVGGLPVHVGVPVEVAARWRAEAGAVDVAALWGRHRTGGVTVVDATHPLFPEPLRGDPEPPAVLFVRGDPAALARPRVAVVGTRRCTPTGRAVASELGRDLAGAGVCVISGLALGIDGAAHAGALEASGAPPAAVVATGVDLAYPVRHAGLWEQVAAAGVLLSEHPLGTRPEPWRFPSRNRVIAGLAEVVVVVESRARGGSMHTVEAALERDRTVMAVPGSVRSAASDGTNGLLSSGAAPARDAGDVLVALGLGGGAGPPRARPTPPGGDGGRVLEAVGHEPVTLEQVASRLDVPLGPLSVHLAALEAAGWLVRRGGWYERSEPRTPASP
jgi:DNA processing protein